MSLEGLLKYPATFLVAFCLTYLLVPIVAKLAALLGIVDKPEARRINDRVIPRAGGLAVFIGFHACCATVFLFPWNASFCGILTSDWWLNFFVASSILLIVGLIDDAFNIKWSTKLAGQAVAAFFLFQHGVAIGQIQGIHLSTGLDLLLTLAWILAFTNAFNLIDGLDGLATGLAIIAALGLAGASLFSFQPSDTLVLLGLVGACLAFLRFNFNPASIFLGDSGSMFLGFTLAAFSISTSSKSTAIAAIGVPILAVGVPVLDTMLAVWRRSVRAMAAKAQNSNSSPRTIMQADLDHLHHRLLHAGLSQRKVAASLYVLNAALVSIGLLSLAFHSKASGIFIVAFVLGSYVMVRHLARVELWDSGTAIVRGLQRPSRSLLLSILYPAFDSLALCISLAIAVFLSQPDLTLQQFKLQWLYSIPVWCGLPFIGLFLSGTYNRVWSRARLTEFLFSGLCLAAGVLLALGTAFILQTHPQKHLLLLQSILHLSLSTTFVLGLRVTPRAIQDLMGLFDKSSAYSDSKNTWGILVYGAGFSGILYLKHKSFNPSSKKAHGKVVGFIDDDRNLRGRLVHGHAILGGLVDLPDIASKYQVQEIVIASHLTPEVKDKLIDFCSKKEISLSEWLSEERSVSPSERSKNNSKQARIIRL